MWEGFRRLLGVLKGMALLFARSATPGKLRRHFVSPFCALVPVSVKSV